MSAKKRIRVEPRPGKTVIVFHRSAPARDHPEGGRFSFNDLDKMKNIPPEADPTNREAMLMEDRTHEFDVETWIEEGIVLISASGYIFGRCAQGKSSAQKLPR